MIKILKARIKQGTETIPIASEVRSAGRFRGLPQVNPSRCRCSHGCDKCTEVCPTGAVLNKPLSLDLGLCTFCGECAKICSEHAIEFSRDTHLATRKKDDLVLRGQPYKRAEDLEKKILKIFGRSLKFRVVSAGSCGGCEVELNAISNIQFDISRFGIQIVASPRHADGLIVAGPVSNNMKLALEKTYAAVASPKIVVAVGACAISGGVFRGSPEVQDGADEVVPVDLFIPGCPPHPFTIVDGIANLMGAARGLT